MWRLGNAGRACCEGIDCYEGRRASYAVLVNPLQHGADAVLEVEAKDCDKDEAQECREDGKADPRRSSHPRRRPKPVSNTQQCSTSAMRALSGPKGLKAMTCAFL